MSNATRIYANAVASYNAGKLLDREQIKRLTEADFADAVKIVCDYGYGGGLLSDAHYDVDRFIADETAKLIEYVETDSPNEMLSRCLLNRFLYANAKSLYKNRFTDVDLDAALYRMDGLETLEKAIEQSEYAALNPFLEEALTLLDAYFSDTPVSPKVIDLTLTRALYADSLFCANKSKSKMLTRFVRAEIDWNNLTSMFRCKTFSLSETAAKEYLLDGGTLCEDELLGILSVDEQVAVQTFYATAYGEALVRLVESGKLARFQTEADDYLFEMTNAEASDMLSLSPFVGYFTAKLKEFRTVKMILTCLRNNAREEISLRLGAAYTL